MLNFFLKFFMISNPIYRGIASLYSLAIFKDSIRMFCLSNSCCKHNLNPICRKSNVYSVERFNVPDNKVSWSIPWKSYLPSYFTAEHLKYAQWADQEIGDENFNPRWNEQDGGIDRRSYNHGKQIQYLVVDGYPLNPRGRTGLRGRGRLGRWGPNHAGDAIVTRWKSTPEGIKILDTETGLPTLQFIAIRRKDCGKWAIPGGFLDMNEAASLGVLRELFEEAINIDKFSPDKKAQVKNFLEKNSKQVYKGYVDDPRNTDNAWIETTALNFHDETGKTTSMIVLDARDDATDATWIDIDEKLEVYETHLPLLEIVLNCNLSSCS